MAGMVQDALTLARTKVQRQNIPTQTPNSSDDLENWFQKGENHYWGNGVPRDYAEAVSWYRKAAEQGHFDAQNHLGFCYQHGKGVARDCAKAVEWYRKAAAHGHLDAQNSLAFCNQYGEGVPRDYAEAADLYRKAAEQGYHLAQNNLGFCYEHGQGVPQTRPGRGMVPQGG